MSESRRNEPSLDSPSPSEAISIAQKVVALDARYNAHRPLPHQHSEPSMHRSRDPMLTPPTPFLRPPSRDAVHPSTQPTAPGQRQELG